MLPSIITRISATAWLSLLPTLRGRGHFTALRVDQDVLNDVRDAALGQSEGPQMQQSRVAEAGRCSRRN